MSTEDALKELRKHKRLLSPQQMRTIKGQILSGNVEGALKGLRKLINRFALGGDM